MTGGGGCQIWALSLNLNLPAKPPKRRVWNFRMGANSRIRQKECDSMQRKIWFFGHFGGDNFGNEITLQTILHHLHLRVPDAKVACICSGPEALGATQRIETVPIGRRFVKPWRLRSRLARWLRRVFIGGPSELCRWLEAFKTLKSGDILIVPGTGLLTDACGLTGWGPYNVFKWSMVAKLRGCQLLFVSVGAGPLGSRLGKYFVKSALSIANFRSYRDEASMAHLKDIGFRTNGDRVYPDLAFSLPEIAIPHDGERRAGRPVVGLGLMTYDGMYGTEKPSNGKYQEYLDNLVVFAGWLLAHDYVVRLLIGDLHDRSVSDEFKSLVRASHEGYDEEQILDRPPLSVEELLAQIAATDIVVATRFHNALLALVLNKPVVAISFHSKCASLMSDMDLAEYCLDINHLSADGLIQQFQEVDRNAENLKLSIRQRVEQSRKALDEQYKLIFKSV
jgi:polysaccharide pyruvyl transferase WcaK-like protein